jgi:hypothetical protein
MIAGKLTFMSNTLAADENDLIEKLGNLFD